MKGLALFLLGAVLGGAATFGFVGGAMTGAGAAAGIVTGLKAGACLTVEGARNAGIITAAEVDAVLKSAGRELTSTDMSTTAETGLSAAECEKLVADMRAGVGAK